MKTIMVIGGGILQLPVILQAKRMGLKVAVMDMNPNSVGMEAADFPINVSTRDVHSAIMHAKAFNLITPVSGVLTVGTDVSVTVASIAEALGLPGIKVEDAIAASHKGEMRDRFRKKGVPQPRYFRAVCFTDTLKAVNDLGFPTVIKPVDNMGARGVRVINNIEEISGAFNEAMKYSHSKEIILEEFMQGPELSIDAIVYNDEITITGIADRIIKYPPYFVETGHNMPSALPLNVQEDAICVMSEGIRALGISNGAAKGDIKITKNGAMIGELAARLSGGFMSTHTYPLSSGVDLMRIVTELALGEKPISVAPKWNRVSIERSIILEPGVIKEISGLKNALNTNGITNIFLDINVGDVVTSPRNNVNKAGHVIAVGDSLEECEYNIKECLQKLKIETEN